MCHSVYFSGFGVSALPAGALVPAGLPAAKALAVLGLAERFDAAAFNSFLLGCTL